MGCRQSRQKQQQDPLPLINMLVLGLTSSGKSTILNQLKGQPQASSSSDLGIDNFIINKKVKVMVFQVAGRASNSWHNYYGTSDIVIFVVDALDGDQFAKVKQILKEMDPQIGDQTQIIIVFNKVQGMLGMVDGVVDQETSHITDILDRNSVKVKQLDKFEVPTLKHKLHTCKCSGKTKLGINTLIKKIYAISYKKAYGVQWDKNQSKV